MIQQGRTDRYSLPRLPLPPMMSLLRKMCTLHSLCLSHMCQLGRCCTFPAGLSPALSHFRIKCIQRLQSQNKSLLHRLDKSLFVEDL